MERYSIIRVKNPREIILLRGSGCIYKQCIFCDYYHDSSPDHAANFKLNQAILNQVTGIYGNLEIINSGSVFELEHETLDTIQDICTLKRIHTLHFESHYLYKNRIDDFRKRFSPFEVKMKLGLETFDHDFRESVLKKGIHETNPAVIAEHFDEVNLLFGLSGQSISSMKRDIELGLKYFERICVNIMCKNTTPIQPDPNVIRDFTQYIYPQYKDHQRVDILLNNTDFGVGQKASR